MKLHRRRAARARSPGPDSAASCYLVEADGFRLVLDLGAAPSGHSPGTPTCTSRRDACSRHLHPDHCLDLCGYYVARSYRPGGPAPRGSRCTGRRSTAQRLARAYGLPGEPAWRGVRLPHRGLGDEHVEVGPLRVTAVRRCSTRSRPTASGSSTTARCSPTPATPAICDALVALAQDADLLLREASFLEGRDDAPEVHLTGRRGRPSTPRAPAPAGCCSPTSGLERPGERRGGGRAVYAGPVRAGPARARRYDAVTVAVGKARGACHDPR